MRRRRGFTLVELLVVVGIIGIIAAMYMVALGRARGKAKQLVASEAVRQDHIGRLADNANYARLPVKKGPGRKDCRKAYRRYLETGSGETIVTRVLYMVRDEDEFEAYWYTLINPDAEDPLEYSGTSIVAKNKKGKEFVLQEVDRAIRREQKMFPVSWTYLSTNMADMESGTIGANVLFSDGHTEYMHYPGDYPVCKKVAELSHEYVKGTS